MHKQQNEYKIELRMFSHPEMSLLNILVLVFGIGINLLLNGYLAFIECKGT